MLDSSPIRGPISLPVPVQAPPPPPKKLKRSASVASLPSPPPSVQPPRKRAGRIGLKPRKGSYAGDSDTEQLENDGVDGINPIAEEDGESTNKVGVVGRVILFPTAASLTLPNGNESGDLGMIDDDDDGDPFVVRESSPLRGQSNKLGSDSGLRARRSLSPVRRSPRLQAALNIAPIPLTPVKLKTGRSSSFPRQSTRASARKPKDKDEDKGICEPHELPVIDDTEDNPFFVKSTPKSKKSSKGRGKVMTDVKTDSKDKVDQPGKDEKPTVTYVFKGVKTHFPNPYYNLPSSAYERAQLPLDHPDYEPLPAGPSKLTFEPKKRSRRYAAANGKDKDEGFSGRPVMTSDEEKDEVDDDNDDGDGDERARDDVNGTSTPDSSPRPPEPCTPENKPRVNYSGFKSDSGKPILDSGPEGVRGAVMDPDEIGRMAMGPTRDGGSRHPHRQRQASGASYI